MVLLMISFWWFLTVNFHWNVSLLVSGCFREFTPLTGGQSSRLSQIWDLFTKFAAAGKRGIRKASVWWLLLTGCIFLVTGYIDFPNGSNSKAINEAEAYPWTIFDYLTYAQVYQPGLKALIMGKTEKKKEKAVQCSHTGIAMALQPCWKIRTTQLQIGTTKDSLRFLKVKFIYAVMQEQYLSWRTVQSCWKKAQSYLITTAIVWLRKLIAE